MCKRISDIGQFILNITDDLHKIGVTVGNYATRDTNGMCHLMPLWHLPEWKEEDEGAFVHRGNWIPNKGLNNTRSAIVNCIYKKPL